MKICCNCTEPFKQDYNVNDLVMSKEFCHRCNRNLNLSFILTTHMSSIKSAEFLFCLIINKLTASDIFDLSEFKDLNNENDSRE